jgi:hypothetical protein
VRSPSVEVVSFTTGTLPSSTSTLSSTSEGGSITGAENVGSVSGSGQNDENQQVRPRTPKPRPIKRRRQEKGVEMDSSH